MQRFQKIALDAVNAVLPEPALLHEIQTPPDPSMGDLGYPCFRLAKAMKKAPPVIAQELVAKIKERGGAEPLEVLAVGPYVNFRVPPQLLFESVLPDVFTGEYGKAKAKSQGKWVLEYSSPNIAKPFQIYHLRGTALGAALARIGKYRGFDVISINHLGDWGTQYGKLSVAFRLFGHELPDRPTMDQLVDIYVRVHVEAEKDKSLEDEARESFLKLEKGDPQMVALWKKCLEISLKEFDRIYKRIGVQFDHIWGESHYKDLLDPLVEDLKKRGILEQSEGAWIVPVTDEKGAELPPCLMLKKDGATLYATRDMAAALYRYEKFHFDRMTYIVGGEQKLHFKQLFAVLRKTGNEWVKVCEHIPTGLYRFKDAKMSTRKGNFFTLENVLALAKERVVELLKARASDEDSHVGAADFEDIAEKVAVGAVLFNDLSTDPVRDVEFDLERVVDFNGETGPYLQYAHTRCLSVLRKAADVKISPDTVKKVSSRVTHPLEIQLAKQLGHFPSVLDRCLESGKAMPLASYLLDLTKVFGHFYRECRVIGEATEVSQVRLLLVDATRVILKQGLGFLGVPLPDRM